MSTPFEKARDAAAMTWAVMTNAGRLPRQHKCMVLLEPTSICNLACPLCPTGTGTLDRKNKFMPLDMVDRIIEVTAPVTEGYVLNLFGEPTLHPEFERILKKTSRLPTWLSTHLNYCGDIARKLAKYEHLRIICSIDTLNPEEYPEYRINGNYDKVLENLRILSLGSCSVYPQFLLPEDQPDPAPYEAFARTFNIPADNLHLKIKLENFRLDPTDTPEPGVCHWPYVGLYFNCDGYQLPCCNNVGKELHMAHIDDIRSIEDLYGGPKGVTIRKNLAKNKNMYRSCGRCDGLNFWETEFLDYFKAVARKGNLFLKKHKPKKS